MPSPLKKEGRRETPEAIWGQTKYRTTHSRYERTIKMQHEKSILPKGKNWKLIWNDEFDGTELDSSKWSFRRHLLHRKFETYTDQAAWLDGNGVLHLQVLEKDGQYYSSQLQTGENFLDRPSDDDWPIAPFSTPKFMHKYGYYECRCKFPEQTGRWCAFWLQSPVIGSSPDPVKAGVEVDIVETFSDYSVINNQTISHNTHWSGYGKDHLSGGLHAYDLQPTPDGFHLFGLDWSRSGYVFYVDGQESYRMESPVSDTEQFVLLTTECDGYRTKDWKGCPTEALKNIKLPDDFLVDFVRVYDEEPK